MKCCHLYFVSKQFLKQYFKDKFSVVSRISTEQKVSFSLALSTYITYVLWCHLTIFGKQNMQYLKTYFTEVYKNISVWAVFQNSEYKLTCVSIEEFCWMKTWLNFGSLNTVTNSWGTKI